MPTSDSSTSSSDSVQFDEQHRRPTFLFTTELRLPDPPIRTIGIDLGTTNSAVAEVFSPSTQESLASAECLPIVQNTESGPMTDELVPSVVVPRVDMIGHGAKMLRASADPPLKRNQDIFYETKNDMGLQRTYHRGPAEFRSPPELAAKILAFLNHAAQQYDPDLPARTVVTVPASFQSAQRRDTVRAARLAGLKVESGDLLDEPVAAFVDYMVAHPIQCRADTNLVVFDFGGGTCDVAVFTLAPTDSGTILLAQRAVSRYHRIGGGDIDRAIVHEVLIPQLVEQASLRLIDLDYRDRMHIEPALLTAAEQLKIGLTVEITRLRSFGKYEDQRDTLHHILPNVYPCRCPSRSGLALRSPRLSAYQFDQVLEPFLDNDFLYARDTEYYTTRSIFSPISSSLDSAEITPAEVNMCLLVGGSSLIPQVRDAVARFFSASVILAHGDRQSTQIAVARGAAYNALSLALTGKSILEPVASENLYLSAEGGPIELIRQGVAVPYPSSDNRWAENTELTVPETADFTDLRVEVVAGSERRAVFFETWTGIPVANRGDPLLLRYRYDEHQVLHLEMSLADRPGLPAFSGTIENPMSHVENPHAARKRIDETEEKIRTRSIRPSHSVLYSLARDYSELNQPDKAIHFLTAALSRLGRADAGILTTLGIQYGHKRDWKRQERAYREAFQALPHWNGPLFNLALSQKRRGCIGEAEGTIKEALEVERDGPELVLAGQIYQKLGRAEAADAALEEAFSRFGPLRSLKSFELGWYAAGARMLGDQQKSARAAEERRRRAQGDFAERQEGVLPKLSAPSHGPNGSTESNP